MINIYFYITGIITATTTILAIIINNNNNNLKKINDSLKSELQSLREFKLRKDKKLRKALYIWSGWHKKDDPSNQWQVYVYLTEVAQSEKNPNIRQFSIDDIVSRGKNDTWQKSDYESSFNKNFGGGWLDTTMTGFTWITVETLEDKRDDKLEQLGI